MKTRTEQLLARQGLENRELKRGYGGIRDIEFAIQLLQLVHGRHDHSIRAPCHARRARTARRPAATSRSTTRAARRGLRVAPHGRAPAPARRRAPDAHPSGRRRRAHASRTRARLPRPTPASRRSSSSTPSSSGIKRSCARSTRSCSSRRCSTRWPESARSRWRPREERLIAFGFRDVEQTRAALDELTAGLTRRSRVMQQLLPAILGWLSAAPDPDLGLLALRRLTEGYNRSSTLARRFRESPIAAERTCRILGSSRDARRRAVPAARRSSTRSPTTRAAPTPPWPTNPRAASS